MTTATIYRYDDQVLFYPIIQPVVTELSIWEKTIERNEVKGRTRLCFITQVRGGKEVGITHQGFWKKIMRAYVLNGYLLDIHDERTSRITNGFPAPDLQAMYGFRFSQRELLTTALTKDESGLIGAPTRWGKSCLLANTIRAYPTLRICVTAPGVDLVKQLYEELSTGKFKLEKRRVHLVCSGHGAPNFPLRSGDVIICSADSLKKLDSTEYDLLLGDEPHELVTDERLPVINAFNHARRIGFGATLTGRFDGRDKLIEGLFGPVLAERTYLEAVEEGAICPLHVIFLKVELTPQGFRSRQHAYNSLFFENEERANQIRRICEEVIPEEFQTLIFIKHERQADMLQDILGRDTCVAMAKKLTTKEREEITAKLKNNVVKRCLCSKIYVKGVTFSDVRVLINAEAGGNNTSSIQKPGRLAEIRPGKKCGIIIDFFFDSEPYYSDIQGDWRALIADSYNRRRAYQEKGYGISYAGTIAELKKEFKKLV